MRHFNMEAFRQGLERIDDTILTEQLKQYNLTSSRLVEAGKRPVIFRFLLFMEARDASELKGRMKKEDLYAILENMDLINSLLEPDDYESSKNVRERVCKKRQSAVRRIL